MVLTVFTLYHIRSIIIFGDTNMEEIWKDVPGFPGYEVSSLGKIRSYHNNYGRICDRPVRLLRPKAKNKGYLEVCLVRIEDGKRTRHSITVHNIVARAFIGPRPSGDFIVICHSDGDKTNNSYENLRYDTHFGNMKDAVMCGQIKRGSENPMSKLTEIDVIEIRRLHESRQLSQTKLAKKFNVCRSNIRNIIERNTWRHI